MANVRSLNDYTSKDDRDDKNRPSAFTGGEKSGLAVENPENDGSPLVSAFPWANAIRQSSAPPPDAKKVTVYKNGFIIEGGKFRSFDDPQNTRFLKNLQAGYAPPELQGDGDAPVHVALNDKKDEIYPQSTLFTGEGRTMGTAASGEALEVDLTRNFNLTIDDSQPTTTLQIRFHNGQRKTQQFNETHTVGDLHGLIMELAPLNGEYRLLTGFPPQELELPSSTTLKDAGLLNSAITQKRC